jgi:hypothetical protein
MNDIDKRVLEILTEEQKERMIKQDDYHYIMKKEYKEVIGKYIADKIITGNIELHFSELPHTNRFSISIDITGLDPSEIRNLKQENREQKLTQLGL